MGKNRNKTKVHNFTPAINGEKEAQKAMASAAEAIEEDREAQSAVAVIDEVAKEQNIEQGIESLDSMLAVLESDEVIGTKIYRGASLMPTLVIKPRNNTQTGEVLGYYCRIEGIQDVVVHRQKYILITTAGWKNDQGVPLHVIAVPKTCELAWIRLQNRGFTVVEVNSQSKVGTGVDTLLGGKSKVKDIIGDREELSVSIEFYTPKNDNELKVSFDAANEASR